MTRYGIAPGSIDLLDGFESFMFEFREDEGEFILRIGHSLRRSIPLIQGEVNWINYLAAGGAGVARVVDSRQGNLVETIPDGQGENFLATAFIKARGHTPGKEDWTPAFNRAYGRLVGCVHRLTQGYQPPANGFRPRWDDPINMHVEELLPASEAQAAARYRELIAHLRALPESPGSFGLIHQDAHSGNFFVDEEGHLTLFDFDDCCYGHFIYDIAMVLFYASMWDSDGARFTRAFMPGFLEGYREENRLDPAWLEELPGFLKLREIDLYAVIHRSFDVDHLEDPWVIRYMTGRKERIDSGAPYIDFDFSSLKAHLA